MALQSYQRNGKKRWRIDETITQIDGSTIRVRKSGFADTKTARQYISHVIRAQKHTQGEISVADVLDRYFRNKTYKSKNSDISRAKHLVEHLGTERLTNINQAAIDEYRNARLATTDVQPATLDKEVELLQRAARYALGCGWVSFNPIANVKLLSRPNTRDRAITRDEMDRLLEHLDEQATLFMLLALHTGMRKMEILSLRWSQLEFAHNVVYITVRAINTKNKMTRIIPMSTKSVLTMLKKAQKPGIPFVFSDGNGGHMLDMRRPFERARAAAGLDWCWMHDIRRTFVTEKRRAGVPETVIMQLTGHKTNSSFRRYSAVNMDDMLMAVSEGSGD